MKLIAVIIINFSILFNINAQYDPKAKAILDNVSNKYQSLKGYKATFSYNIFSPVAEVDETQKGKITVSGAKFLLDLGKQQIINDGKTVWTYIVEEEEVNVMDYEPEEGEITPSNIYNMYKEGYKYIYKESVEKNGVKYDVIDLSPVDTDNEFFKIRLTIHSSNFTIKKWKIFEKNGNRYTYSITTFNENPGLSSKAFGWDKAKYPNVEINDLR